MILPFFPSMMAAAGGGPPVGQAMFTASATWVVPEGVTSICVVCIGRGAGAPDTLNSGTGGSLRYVNNIPVTPGESLSVSETATYARLVRGSTVLCQAAAGGASLSGQVGTGRDGGLGRTKVAGQSLAGPGAGGYTSLGQNTDMADTYRFVARGGQGSDPYGRRLDGGLAGRAPGGPWNDVAGGEDFGGGGGLYYNTSDGSTQQGGGGDGCVRIIWGPGRFFPNTLTEDMT